jgi:hypothetical protein
VDHHCAVSGALSVNLLFDLVSVLVLVLVLDPVV